MCEVCVYLCTVWTDWLAESQLGLRASRTAVMPSQVLMTWAAWLPVVMGAPKRHGGNAEDISHHIKLTLQMYKKMCIGKAGSHPLLAS